MAGRFVALVAAAVPTIVGLIRGQDQLEPTGHERPRRDRGRDDVPAMVTIGTVVIGLFAWPQP